MASSLGRFVWYDLNTTDVAAAKDFYTKVVGWTLTEFEGSPEPYTMWTNGENTIGGVAILPEQAKQMGAPPHWLAYVAVSDCDATLAKVKELGGTLMADAFDIPTVGRIGIFADNTGAVIAAFQPASEMQVPYGDTVPAGFFSWHELMSTDAAKAHAFYKDLFGWVDSDKMDMGPEMGVYQMYKAEGMEFALGGMMNKPAEMPMSAWMYYIKVDDFDAALTRVTDNGGKLISDPMEVPGGDRVVPCMDPQGAAFALHGK